MPAEVFTTEQVGRTLIVNPQGAALDFHYGEVHAAANALFRQLDDPSVQHLIVDLSEVDYVDSIIIGAIIRILQKTKMAGGQAVFSAASGNMMSVLESIKIGTLWPCYDDRDQALADLEPEPQE